MFGYNYVDDGYINTNTTLDRGGAERLTHGGPAPRAVRGQLRLQLGLGQDARQRHLPHGLPQPPPRDPARLRRQRAAGTDRSGRRARPTTRTGTASSATCSARRDRWPAGSTSRGDMDTAGHLPARLGRLGALPRGPAGRGDHAAARQLRLRDQLREVGPGIATATLPELALPQPEARVLRRGPRLHLALGGPDRARRKLYTLPAKARYDAGTPFVQP